MDGPSFEHAIGQERNFTLRRALERLREGVFDPFAVQLLTAHEDKLVRAFEQGLSSPTGDLAPTSASAATTARENHTASPTCRKTP